MTNVVRIGILGVLAMMLALGGCAGVQTNADKSAGPVKVVYHINNSAVASAALHNIENHLSADPTVKIVVVTHGLGVDFLLDGAADKNGNPYSVMVDELLAKGVDFRVCNNTLSTRKIDPKKVLPGAKIVPSGVAELGKLQNQEGFVYIKP